MSTDKEIFEKNDLMMMISAARDEAEHYRNIIERIKGECSPSVQRRIEKVLKKYVKESPSTGRSVDNMDF